MKKFIVFVIALLFIGMSFIPPTGGIGGNYNSSIDNKTKVTFDEASSFDNETEYWALLIAVGVYAGHPEEDRPEMLTQVEDLRQKLLVSDHWKDENIKVIKGRNATLLNILRGFKWLYKREEKNDFSLVYITTHGGPHKRDRFPWDEEDGCDEILATYLSFMFPRIHISDDFLNLLLSLLNSKGVCVIIDSCHSGGFNDSPYFSNGMNDNSMTTDEWMYEFGEDLSESGRVVLMSCSEDELSQAYVFTHYLTEGLTGYADANEDEFVSAEESLEYVRDYCKDFDMNVTIFDDYAGELQLTVVELPPSVPKAPVGQDFGDINTTYFYSTVSTDPEGSKISYGWDWDGDFVVDEWTDFVDSNTTVNISHSWTVEGIYNVKVIAKDEIGLYSEWSNYICVIMCGENIPDQWQRETDYGCWFYKIWLAQSFVPSLDTLSKVEIALRGYGSGDSKPLQIYIRDNLSGDNIAESIVSIPELGDDKWAWYTFDFENIDVIPGGTYYIVCVGRSDWTFGWKWKKGNPYPSGETFWSEDGNEWHVEHHNDPDGCFVTWSKI